MKKILVMGAVILFTASSIFAAPFSPTLLKLSASPQITYKFDGTQLAIPVTLTGKPSNSTFMIYTKDKGDVIGKVRNGYLGYHYVNKIDTCIYMSPPIKMITGSNTITWDGKDNYGTKVPAGAYTYYLWGFDDQTPKELAIKNVSQQGTINCREGRDVKGIPLANPVLYFGFRKWVVGVDPQTEKAAMETTSASRPDISRYGAKIELDPKDHNLFWQMEKSKSETIYETKYKWNPNATATIETTWGENGTHTWDTVGTGALNSSSGIASDGKDILFDSYWNCFSTVAASKISILNMSDGSPVRTIDLQDWYSKTADVAAGAQLNGGPSDYEFRNGHLIVQAMKACMTLSIDPYRDPGDEVIWANGNGDYIHDLNYDPSMSKTPWVCNDYNAYPIRNGFSTDSNEFFFYSEKGVGVVSFGVIGPSGKGIGAFSVAGETTEQKRFIEIIDEDTAYDGMYLDNLSNLSAPNGNSFIGHDSIKGVISTGVGVDEAAPAAFTVAQNSPNPFNPNTTISFTLAKAGKVTIDIYNAAGQKIDTLVSTTMNAGNHSAVWNASKHSAGVYFYTVKSGDFSKTMKMTLLK